MAKDSIVIYKSVADALSELDAETYKKVMTSIFDYAYDGVDPVLGDGVEKIVWLLIKPQLDACIKRYEAQVENGKKRWKAKDSQLKPNLAKVNQQKPSGNQIKPNDNVYDNDNDNDNDNDDDDVNENVKKRTHRIMDDDNPDDDYDLRHEGEGEVHFKPTVKLGMKSAPVKHDPLTEEDKERLLCRTEGVIKRLHG